VSAVCVQGIKGQQGGELHMHLYRLKFFAEVGLICNITCNKACVFVCSAQLVFAVAVHMVKPSSQLTYVA
jgi:hypothetical protein